MADEPVAAEMVPAVEPVEEESPFAALEPAANGAAASLIAGFPPTSTRALTQVASIDVGRPV